MSLFKNCYKQNFELYDSLMAYHDFQKRILPSINEIVSVKDKFIADIGCGTGILTSLFVDDAKKVCLCDSSTKMLEGAKKRLRNISSSKFEIHLANTFNLPYSNNTFDIIIEGWSLSFCIKDISLWDKLIEELLRILKKDGVLIIIETLGYGVETPNCTNSHLNAFYSYLVNCKGFDFKWIRTDYKYENENQAILYSNAFFDYEIVEELLTTPKSIIPECTGFWWFTKK